MFALALVFFTFAFASDDLSISERAIRLRFDEGATVAVLPLTNASHQQLPLDVVVELFDPDGEIYATGNEKLEARPGANIAAVALEPSLDELDPAARARMVLYRLRYRVRPLSQAADVEPVAGIVSISEITPDLFELELMHSSVVGAGRVLRATAVATHPITEKPVRDVRVEGRVSIGDDELARAEGRTDDGGLAILDMRLPDQVLSDELSLSVHVSKGPTTADLQSEVFVARGQQLLMTTDKRLYQPGQSLHVRFVAFDWSRRAIRGAKGRIRITVDPEDELVFAGDVVTSRFGVASLDWQIPEESAFGYYRVKATLDEADWGNDASAVEVVQVGRYDIPEFTVSPEADRSFYLPGENASVEIRADYVFGEPVTRASARLVHIPGYWERDQAQREIGAGRLDEAGRLNVGVDLSTFHEGHPNWSGYRDLDFEVYVTDETTRRTERRRFRLRISREPLHVYGIDFDGAIPGKPHDFYVSTSVADGTPIACDVTVRQQVTGAVLARTRTNRFGVAKIEGMIPPQATRGDDERVIVIEARDDTGREGRETRRYWWSSDDDDDVELRTEKTLHRAGEPIRASIDAPAKYRRALVEVFQRSEVLHSRLVELKSGHAEVAFDYDPLFRGELGLVATPLNRERSRYRYWREVGYRTIVYPRDDTALTVRAEAARARYAPGEEARVRFDVRRPDGEGAESAIGVVVVDEALLEREREAGFGEPSSIRNLDEWVGGKWGLGGVSTREIESLDESGPFSEELDLVAEILYRGVVAANEGLVTERHWTNVSSLFASTVQRDLAPLKPGLDDLYQDGYFPETLTELEDRLGTVGIELQALPDP